MESHESSSVDVETTAPRTLWTLTMMEVLYDDLVKDRSDQNIQNSIKELYAKNVKPSQLVRKVARDLGTDYSARLKGLMENKRSV